MRELCQLICGKIYFHVARGFVLLLKRYEDGSVLEVILRCLQI